MSSALEAPNARRFIRELLKQTRGEKVTSLDLIRSHASCSTELSERFVTELGLSIGNGEVRLSREARLDLAMEEASRGFLYEASRFLEWMDFERFAERCLQELGFDTERNVRFKGSSRRWQVDVVGLKSSLLVCIDCKHWAPPMSPSRFRVPEMHQSEATKLFAERVARERQCKINALPIILTLFELHFSQPVGAVIVDIQRLPGMLRDLTPYTPSMPFLNFSPEDGRKPYQA